MTKDNNLEEFLSINTSDFPSAHEDEKYNIDDKELWELKKIRYIQNTHHRACLSRWVMRTTSIWLICVIIILALCGLGYFEIEGPVLITLLATTTVNVLGLPYIILKGLFL